MPGIERDPERQGGEPCIAGTRVPVRAVHEAVELGDRSPEAAAEAFGVSLADVYRALTYYHDHREEMERIETEREQAKRRSIDGGVTTLADLRDEDESGRYENGAVSNGNGRSLLEVAGVLSDEEADVLREIHAERRGRSRKRSNEIARSLDRNTES